MKANGIGIGKVLTLSEVTRKIQEVLSERFNDSFWVKAEMNKLNLYPQSGHCYPDLVEKVDGKIVAEMRSNIWKDDYLRINTNFLRVLREPLKDGISILFSAKVSFHPVYGLSLRIIDIDASYSLGELEKEKQQTMEALRKEGIFLRNRSVKMALLPKRIAVISAETSKGYSDFRSIIEENPWGYRFFHMLFPAFLQGDNAVDSIILQLKRIEKVRHHFDVVAIIRGGGGDIGLSSYNNYSLSRTIALFPLPVLTGIGHSTNETVAEMVSHRNAITPSELADLIIQKFHNFAVPVGKAAEQIRQTWESRVRSEKAQMMNTVRFLKSVTGSKLISAGSGIREATRHLWVQSLNLLQQKRETGINHRLRMIGIHSGILYKERGREMELAAMSFRNGLSGFLNRKQHALHTLETSVTLLDPVKVLERGYSITLSGGKAVKSVEDVAEGTSLRTILKDGGITSIVNSKEKHSSL